MKSTEEIRNDADNIDDAKFGLNATQSAAVKRVACGILDHIDNLRSRLDACEQDHLVPDPDTIGRGGPEQEQPESITDDELPGMWSTSDFTGGATENAYQDRQPKPAPEGEGWDWKDDWRKKHDRIYAESNTTETMSVRIAEQLYSIPQRLADDNERLTDWADLMCDEFKRIRSCPGADEEIKGLCDRAVSNTKQHVPVIVQRDTALARVGKLELREAAIQDGVQLLTDIHRLLPRMMDGEHDCEDCSCGFCEYHKALLKVWMEATAPAAAKEAGDDSEVS